MAVAAYASLLNLAQALSQIQHLHDKRSIVFNKQQVLELQNKVQISLQLLEALPQPLSSKMEKLTLEMKVVIVETELRIDAEVVDQICEKNDGLSSFALALNGVIKKLELMIVDMKGELVLDISLTDSTETVFTNENSSEETTIVGLEEKVNWIITKLTSHEKSLQVIPIVGMGGVGKTTLVRQVFENSKVKLRFDRRKWCTVSKYTHRHILTSLLEEETNEENRDLGLKLYKNLYGRRYLIVLDDMWSIDDWEYLMKFLPDNGNGSRIIVTTRMSNIADSLNSHRQCIMKLLDEGLSWNLLCDKIFKGQQECPDELEKIGRNIAKNCRGLPISLVTIGGLLSKSQMTVEYWENVAQNVNKFAGYEDDGHCMKVLSLSYISLPIHLKPCFLYFRCFSEDPRIHVEDLLERWIDEGFVKPISGKRIEDVAEGYMKDLIGRNLISLHHGSIHGEECGIHDLLREMCLSESEKENFLLIPRTSYWYNRSCCMCGLLTMVEMMDISQVLPSKAMLQIQVCQTCKKAYPLVGRSKFVNYSKSGQHANFLYSTTARRAILSNTDLNFTRHEFVFPLPVLYLWNLQVLHVDVRTTTSNKCLILPADIWEMQQLRVLVAYGFVLPEPIQKSFDSIILEALHTLHTDGLQLGKKVFERIPNVKKLKFSCTIPDEYPSLHLLYNFLQLEFLEMDLSDGVLMDIITFPCSLKKLVMSCKKISGEQVTAIGYLSNLEMLQLRVDYIVSEWCHFIGQFQSLKVLNLMFVDGIKFSSVESEHFPKLEKLELDYLGDCEIPLSVGDIDTLVSIHLLECDELVTNSAVKILEEQRSFGNDVLELYVDHELYVLVPSDEEEEED